MPRFYFDIYDDRKAYIDREGHEFANVEQVRKEAQRLLPEVAYAEIPADGDPKFYVVLVRDEQHQPIFSATLNYHGLWLDQPVEDTPKPPPPADDRKLNS